MCKFIIQIGQNKWSLYHGFMILVIFDIYDICLFFVGGKKKRLGRKTKKINFHHQIIMQFVLGGQMRQLFRKLLQIYPQHDFVRPTPDQKQNRCNYSESCLAIFRSAHLETPLSSRLASVFRDARGIIFIDHLELGGKASIASSRCFFD